LIDKKELLLLEREIDIMKKVSHPNVLSLVEIYETPKQLSLVMELVTGGELFFKIVDRGSYSEKDASNIVRQIVEGVKYLHSMEIAHRDLKPENLLCSGDTDMQIKIADFGLSKIFAGGHQLVTSCGTPAWAAPEVLKNSRYTEKADVYSYGICLWEFWTRRDPYEGMPTFQIIFVVGNQGERPTIPASCPSDYANLMKDCWNADPERRPGFDEVCARLKNLDTDSYNAFDM